MNKIRKLPAPRYRFWTWESEFNPQTGDSDGNLRIKRSIVWDLVTALEVHNFKNMSHKLAICIRIECMNVSAAWGIPTVFYPAELIKISEMEDFYKEQRKQLLEQVQYRHIVDVGWVLQTYSNRNQVENDTWWQVGDKPITEERQQLWRYYHNTFKNPTRLSPVNG